MRWIGVIPVRRRADDTTGRPDNDAMFSACYDALAERDQVLIFPESVTRTIPSSRSCGPARPGSRFRQE
jgi:1-acyl-sn-glycerol-3-phosphate acyltransferase